MSKIFEINFSIKIDGEKIMFWKRKKKILTLTEDEISKLNSGDLNEDMIKEYCRLGEERLKDCLDTKKQFEQKGSILLSIYMPISLALFGLSMKFELPYIFNISAFCLFIGIFFILSSIHFSDYGSLGRHPEDFLGKIDYNYLTVDKKEQALMYAYNLEYLIDTINISDESNNKKQSKIIIAIWCGAISIVPFVIKFLFSL